MRIISISSIWKMLSRMRYITEKDLIPPYDCPSCQDFNSIVVKVGDGLVKVMCLSCGKQEILVEVPWLGYIDYYCLVADKWNGSEYKEPVFKIEYEHAKDKDKVELLKNVTLGKIVVYQKDKEPVELKDFLMPDPFGGSESLHPWREIINNIKGAKKYFSISEINSNFVKGDVSDQDIKEVMDKAVTEGLLGRVWDKGKYWYGVVLHNDTDR